MCPTLCQKFQVQAGGRNLEFHIIFQDRIAFGPETSIYHTYVSVNMDSTVDIQDGQFTNINNKIHVGTAL